MKQDNREKKYHAVWKKFQNYYQTEGYSLREVFDIYLPFWKCKQNIVVEQEVELDRFSRIILQLVDKGICSHTEICAFLGIEEDSFLHIQFHFLLKYDLLDEPEIGHYEMTHNGLDFLKNKVKLKKVENVDFEYFVVEKTQYLQNQLTQTFFDPQQLIDSELSAQIKQKFKGYRVLETHKINVDKRARKIPHARNKPPFKKIEHQRNDFAAFFNQQFTAGTFYDFATNKLDAHKRSIGFMGLLYEHETTQELKLDIRQSSKSVYSFKGNYTLEKTLTASATQYVQKEELKELG